MSGIPRNDADYSSPQYSSGNTTTDSTSPQYGSSTGATDNSSSQYSAGKNPADTTDFSSPRNTAGAHITHGTDFNNPSHHVRHDESEPLPGAQGARDTVDYSPDNLGNENISRTGDKHTAAADYASTNERRNDSARLPSAPGGRDTIDDRTNNLGGDNTSFGRDKHSTGTNSSFNNERSNQGGNTNQVPGGRTDAFEDNFSRQDDPTHAGFGKDIEAGETKGHAGVGDKVIGKTQQMVGKMTNNADLREKGELRGTSGKEGVYRAPRD
ncbi:hypothetical protein BDN71DRAFT_1437513 [Pleurotus eryngii]|uniref:Uncharacterized protein n=1 Tax=Pleurotus eryngii TaxID=5323 RepID=A0A9P6A8U6_PLEER|nr:hypothetical protein BDN71DRAFT_1437513 [Pleurotus eryngii]